MVCTDRPECRSNGAVLNDLVLDNPNYGIRPAAGTAAESGAARKGMFGEDGFSFWDLLDIVNPLQHIPVVSTVYRALTGDTIDAGSRLAGGALFGGPVGLAASVVSAMVEESTGKDLGEQALAMIGIDLGGSEAATTAVAEAPQPDRVPPELLAAMQPPARQDLKLSVGSAMPQAEEDEEAATGEQEAAAEENAEQRRQQMVAEQAPRFAPAMPAPATAQAMTQPASASPADIIAARARGLQPGARSIAGTPAEAPQVIDNRAWFPAFLQGGAAPVRGVGTSAVTNQNAVVKFGSAKSAPASARPADQQADWAERAAAAYQKYHDLRKPADGQAPGRSVDISQ